MKNRKRDLGPGGAMNIKVYTKQLYCLSSHKKIHKTNVNLSKYTDYSIL